MWKWLTNPLVGAKPANGPKTMRMRKDSDSPDGNNSGSNGSGSNNGSPSGKRPQPGLSTPDDPNKDRDPIPPGTNSDKDEREKREKQQDDAKKPNADRIQDATKDLVEKLAEKYLGSLKDQALDDLGKAWKASPAGTIALGAVLGASAVAILIKTGVRPGKLPAIPLDRLAKRSPIFKDAELNIEVKQEKGPPTEDSFIVSITFKEQPAGKSAPKAPTSGGKPATLKLNLSQGDAKAAKPDVGTDVDIEGEVMLDAKIKAEDAAATVKAIRNAKVEVDIGGTPTYRVQVVSVADNYQGGDYSVNPPPAHRAIKVQLRTSIPPMIRPGKPVIVDATVTVRLNGIRNDGEAKIKVQYQPPSAKDGGKTPDSGLTGLEALDRLNKVLGPGTK